MFQYISSWVIVRPILATVALFAVWTLAVAQTNSELGRTQTHSSVAPLPVQGSQSRGFAEGSSRKPTKKDSFLYREGTELRDQLGHFEITGDSVVFVDSEGRRFGGLRNLNMQRVIRSLRASRNPRDLTWIVSGTVTEFDSQNFLLLSRVVRRSGAK